jgi:hypothetical protein
MAGVLLMSTQRSAMDETSRYRVRDQQKPTTMFVIAVTLLIAVLSHNVSAMGGELNAKTSAIEIIRREVESYALSKSMCTGVNCCTVGSGESCPLLSMPKDQTTLVIPGGETRCIYSYSTPFAFQVWIGRALLDDSVLTFPCAI